MARNKSVALQPEVAPVVQIEEPKAVVVTVETIKAEEPARLTPEWFILQPKEFLIAHFGNKSNAIRGLNAMGHKCGPISRALDIKFQHARNVLSKPLKREIKAEREAAKKAAEQ